MTGWIKKFFPLSVATKKNLMLKTVNQFILCKGQSKSSSTSTKKEKQESKPNLNVSAISACVTQYCFQSVMTA